VKNNLYYIPIFLPAFAMAEKVDFNTEIQPILSQNCYACHGPDEAALEGGLRLDVRESALKGGDSGPAIVPGNPNSSLLIERITHADPDEIMPPTGKKDPLKPEQIELLRRWIEEGAEWGVHWAYVSPERPSLPAVKDESWPANPIDHFVLAKLEVEGLRPSPSADSATMLRRLSLDLTGLPPVLHELEKLGAMDLSAEIDRLLASPHFGERWGREWLDAARYADSAGYEKDLPRQHHFYRDWVVDALNQNLPYNDFIIQQIAGDLLPDAGKNALIATGFLRNSMTNEEGGAKPEQFRIEGIFDRVDAVGKSVLGITTQCAQCHTHKYDPLTHDEYFGMFAFLNSIEEASVAAYTFAEEKVIAEIHAAICTAEQKIKSTNPGWEAEFEKWQADLLSLPKTEWHALELYQLGDSGQKYLPLPDKSVINMGYANTRGSESFSTATELPEIHAARLEILNHPYLPLDGPGRSIRGTGALTEFTLQAGTEEGKLAPLPFTSAAASVNPPVRELDPTRFPLNAQRSKDDRSTGPASFALDGNAKTAWTTELGPGRDNDPQVIHFSLTEPWKNDGRTYLKYILSQQHGGFNSDDTQNFNLGRIRLSIAATLPNALDSLPPLVRESLETAPAKRTPAQNDRLFSHWRQTREELAAINAEIEEHWNRYPAPVTALVARQVEEKRETRLFKRGEQTSPAHIVQPHVPAFLHPLPEGDPASRLTFAKWLVDPSSPTTARYFVNRLWQGYFGKGLVETSEDLGLQSARPSHPELLDWLAVEFMESGWDMKHMHRLIVSSATYRQSSVASAVHRETDPNNRLLARGSRLRVPAESVRDIQLAASGLLDPSLGGRSVFPPAPAYLFQKPVSYGPKTWNVETDSQRYRRALYTFRFRSVPYPVLVGFDAPSGETACVRRSVSTTPLQALMTLNEQVSVEAALGLAHLILTDEGTLDEKFTRAFKRCTSRTPDAEEIGKLKELYESTLKVHQDNPDDAAELLKNHKPVTLDLSAHPLPELAATAMVARVLLNLDETITKN